MGTKREPSSLVQDDDLQRRARAHPGVVQRAHDFQPGHDAVGAVELAARGLRIEVAADRDGQRTGIGAGAPREDVADAVHLDRHAGLLAPAHELVAPAPVDVGEREAAHAALVGGADFRQVHQGLPEAVGVDLQHGQRKLYTERH